MHKWFFLILRKHRVHVSVSILRLSSTFSFIFTQRNTESLIQITLAYWNWIINGDLDNALGCLIMIKLLTNDVIRRRSIIIFHHYKRNESTIS